ncbi:hypothetical protein [Vulcanisaeta sp. JCM 14467]|uniref:hypothetical protein n=1 Tax=Vulcanisaeta sp. JCM 14467 TaxID=1295370 RepID=UPI002092D497|nr:hypothetical protein [Vulcanisaeta sp. JCM 14467]
MMDDEIKEVVNLDDIVRYIESDITYFDLENDEYVGVKVDEVPLQQQSRVILMSATIPPSLLSQFPVIRVPPSQQIIAKIPGWAKAITVEFIEKNKDVLAKKIERITRCAVGYFHNDGQGD